MTGHRIWPIALALFLLGGCEDRSSDLGAPPPVRLTQIRQLVVLPAGQELGPATIASLRQALARLGQPVGIDVMIQAGDRQAAAVRALLLRQGIDPDRIEVAASVGGPASVVLTRTRAVTASCDLAIARAADPSSSLDSLGRCIQQNNLADMLADPRDLVQSPALEPTPAGEAVRAIQELDQTGHGQSDGGGAPAVSSHP